MKELLSAYYDDELSPDKRKAVAQHVEVCDACARELESFQSLSALVENLPFPILSTERGERFEPQLDIAPAGHSRRLLGHNVPRASRQSFLRNAVAIAASVLIAVGWFGYRLGSDRGGDPQMAGVLAAYLVEFDDDPVSAQQILLANYKGQAVSAEQATRAVGYRPAVADGMPEGYTIETTYVVKMPCCNCVQCLCKRSDGTTLAIFEHQNEPSDWFGDRPKTEALCNGTCCCVVKLGDRFAATWRRIARQITVVGANDPAEIRQLVAWFDERKRGNHPPSTKTLPPKNAPLEE